jgi:transcriptional regulator with XRE-family HTH domain
MPTDTLAPTFDARTLRGLLAQERITGTHFARICGLSRDYVSHILTGQRQPGELARIKIARALEALGLDRAVNHGA